MTLFPRCPDGHRWYACSHKELAQPALGKIMMSVGAATAVIGVLEITGIVR